jgi:hypothetical protein
MNPFNHKEGSEFIEAENKVKLQLSELRNIANELLLDQRYSKFSRLVEDAEKNTVSLLLRYKEDDPLKFKSKVSEYLVELNVYRNILNSARDLAEDNGKPKLSMVDNFKSKMETILKRF